LRGVEAPGRETAEGGFEVAFHLFSSSGDGLLEVVGFAGDDKRLEASRTDFELAALVLWASFGAVAITEVDFDARELAVEAVEYTMQFAFDKVGEFCMEGDVPVAVDLNLHEPILLKRGVSFPLACFVRRGWEG
jgi:hypothetical protein